MKPLTAFVIVFTAVLATVVIEEYRIKNLQEEIIRLRALPDLEIYAGPMPRAGTESGSDAVLPDPAPINEPEKDEVDVPEAPTEDQQADPAIGDNAVNEEDTPDEVKPSPPTDQPALSGSMRNVPEDFPSPDEDSVKALAVSAYSDLYYQLGLSNRERAYFEKLLNERTMKRQQLAMKWVQAEAGQRAGVEQEMNSMEEDFLDQLLVFLKRERDLEAFVKYDEKQASRQMLIQMRPIMDQLGVTLEVEKETRAIEVLDEIRRRIGSTAWESIEGLKRMAAGDALEVFDQQWEEATTLLKPAMAEFLNESEVKAFFESRDQLRQSIRASLKDGVEQLSGGAE